jgi:anti-repressor protein
MSSDTKLVSLETQTDTISSLKLLAQINIFRSQAEDKSNLAHSDLLKIIRDEFEEEIGMGKISETPYTHPQNGQTYPMFNLTLSQAKQVLVRESKVVRKAVIAYIEELEKAKKQKVPSYQIQNPIERAKAWIEEETVRQEQAKQLTEQKPIVEFATRIAMSANTISIEEFSKLLPSDWKLGEINLYKLLRAKGVLLSSSKINWNKPAQQYINLGYFEVAEGSYINPKTNLPTAYFKTKITGKGQVWISSKLRDWNYV